MRLLVVSATDLEIAPLLTQLHRAAEGGPGKQPYTYRAHQIDVLITGVGMVATAAWCSRALSTDSYHLALNLGVCGSFDSSFAPGAVVHVTSDRLAELGAEDGARFLTVHELRLVGEDEFPFKGGLLINSDPPVNDVLGRLPAVSAITVNTVHGGEESIASVAARFKPQIETMEGAAFMYACLIHGVRFAQIRAVSNIVEPRNRDAWKLPDAIRNLCATALEILDHL
jgi:futalosine hydrolase